MIKEIAFIILPAALLISACGNQSGRSETADKSNELASNVLPAKETHNSETTGTIHLSKEDFLVKVMNYEKNTTEWKFEGDKPCLIDFYADWCAPCRTAAPILEELASEYSGKINVYKIDTQKEQELAAVFGIQGIPAFLYVPMEGKPTMSSGIGRSVEETRQMFRQNIESLLLN